LCCVCRELLTFNARLIEFVIPNLSRIYFYIPEIFKTNVLNHFFLVQNLLTFWICVLVLWIHKGYCVEKKLVWNVRSKAVWYTKYFFFVTISPPLILWIYEGQDLSFWKMCALDYFLFYVVLLRLRVFIFYVVLVCWTHSIFTY
jgi:hypothetical protein